VIGLRIKAEHHDICSVTVPEVTFLSLFICMMSDLLASGHADDDDADNTSIDIVKIMPCASEVLQQTMTFLYCKLTNLPVKPGSKDSTGIMFEMTVY
jgi:hypothetical protein